MLRSCRRGSNHRRAGSRGGWNLPGAGTHPARAGTPAHRRAPGAVACRGVGEQLGVRACDRRYALLHPRGRRSGSSGQAPRRRPRSRQPRSCIAAASSAAVTTSGWGWPSPRRGAGRVRPRGSSGSIRSEYFLRMAGIHRQPLVPPACSGGSPCTTPRGGEIGVGTPYTKCVVGSPASRRPANAGEMSPPGGMAGVPEPSGFTLLGSRMAAALRYSSRRDGRVRAIGLLPGGRVATAPLLPWNGLLSPA